MAILRIIEIAEYQAYYFIASTIHIYNIYLKYLNILDGKKDRVPKRPLYSEYYHPGLNGQCKPHPSTTPALG
jgi:hypothetical protein